MRVAVCSYGAGNVRSVLAALRRLGADAQLTRDPAEILGADLTVLPGVGSAASAMAGLSESGLDSALRARVAEGGRTLGICLGLQLALEESEEDGGVPGLGLLPGRAVRLCDGRIPRIGWARVDPVNPAAAKRTPLGVFARPETARYAPAQRAPSGVFARPESALADSALAHYSDSGLAQSCAYFAHSYEAKTPAATAHSEGVVAAAEAGSFLGVQFHPEKSGPTGARFLSRWLIGNRRRCGDGCDRARDAARPKRVSGIRARTGGASRRRVAATSRAARDCGSAILMALPRLIPCLDVTGGRVVKGVRFQRLRDVGDPVELGAGYSEAGADELVFLDVAATVDERPPLLDLVSRVADELAIPFTVGGGVRSAADGEALLSAGADKVAVNSAAVERPGLIGELAALLGSQAVVVAVDSAAGEVYTRAGTVPTGRNAVAWAEEAEAYGAGEILLTSIDADGTRSGYDLPLTRAVADAVSIPVIASGGAGEARHVAEALEVAQAALLASILHERPARLGALRDELRGLGVPLRDAA